MKKVIETATVMTILIVLHMTNCSESGAASKEAMFRFNLQHTGVYNTKGVSQLNELLWKFKTGQMMTSYSDPIVAEGVVYIGNGRAQVTDTTTARLFQNGRSQAVRLPRQFRFQGDRVRIRRAGRGVLLEPLTLAADEWFADMDRLGAESLLPEARDQPLTPIRDVDLA